MLIILKTQNKCIPNVFIVYFLCSGWIKHEVPITHIHRCHLLDYERQIVSMVLSHCCYSLKVGEAHTVQYDHQALEKHLLDRFIYGKPIIRSDIPQVAYRNDMYTIVAFNVVRKKVKPQVSSLIDGVYCRRCMVFEHSPAYKRCFLLSAHFLVACFRHFL